MKKYTKITSLAVAALATIGLANAGVNHVQAATKAAEPTKKTTAKAQSPEDIAKANVAKAQANADDAKKVLDEKQAAYDKAQAATKAPIAAYNAQEKKALDASKVSQAKHNDVARAQGKVNEAKSIEKQATPENIAKTQSQLDKETATLKDDTKYAQRANKEVTEKQTALDAAKKNEAVAKKNVAAKTAAKVQADKDVEKAEAAYTDKNLDLYKNNIEVEKNSIASQEKFINDIEANIKKNQASLANNKKALVQNKNGLATANKNLERAQKFVEQKKQELAQAQQALKDAQDHEAEEDSAAGFFESIANNDKNSESVRADAQKALDIIKGKISRPDWYDQEVKIGDKNDSTSLDNLKGTLSYIDNVNKTRKENGVHEIGVSLTDVAAAMLTADYQKDHGMSHPEYYPSLNKSESLAGGWNDPVAGWMTEKATWENMVKAHPEWKNVTDSFGNMLQFSEKHFDDYIKVGHYFNIVDPDARHFGMAQLGSIVAYDLDSPKAKNIFPVNNYKDMVNNYIANVTKSSAVSVAQKNVDTAKENVEIAQQNASKIQNSIDNLQNKVDEFASANKRINDQIVQDQDKITTAKKNIDNFNAKIQDFQNQIDKITASNADKNAAWDKAKDVQSKASDDLTKANSDYQNAQETTKSAQKALDEAKQIAKENNEVLSSVQKGVQNLTKRLSDLKNASAKLAKANSDLKAAQDEAKKAEDNMLAENNKMPALRVAVEKAEKKVSAAKDELNKAKDAYKTANDKLVYAKQALYDIQNPYVPVVDNTVNTTDENKDKKANTEEQAMSGVAHVPSPKDMGDAELQLVDSEGKPSGEYIPTNSNWKVLAKKTINGETYYRLGTNKQWVNAKFVSEVTEGNKSEVSEEQPASGVLHVGVINNNPNWKVALRNGNGKLTGQYISTNSNWKVFGKKTINGETYYRLGTNDQWIPARYAKEKSTTNEVKASGVAHVAVINNNPNWKVALLDGNGHATGKYISTNSNWKVFAKKTVNGRQLVRIGSQLQWIPMQYVSWIR